MGYKRCPNCELNYIKEDEELCDVCKKQLDPNAEEDYFMKNVKRNDVIKSGDVFPFSKHYQLINYLTGSNLKSWYKATYQLTNNCYIWIIVLDGKVRSGWKDILLPDGRIKENFVGKESLPANFDLTSKYRYKAVFEKTGDSFIFMGVYERDNEDTSKYERYYKKVSDTTTLYDF